jgi:virginiamycin B lyase
MRDFKLHAAVLVIALSAASACQGAVQRPMEELTPLAIFKLGKTADWVAITGDAVWVASTGPFAANRIDPKTNTKVASVELPGEACSGLAVGAGSLWVPLCTPQPSLAKIDLNSNKVTSIFPVGPPAGEGGIAYGAGSIWLIVDKLGSLARIDPSNGAVLETFHVPAGSYNPAFLAGTVWVTHADGAQLTGIDAATEQMAATVTTCPNPRFLTVGAGAVWTLNQGDGSLTRVEGRRRVDGSRAAGSRQVDSPSTQSATILLGTPGHGGDIAFGNGKIWTSMPKVPLSLIDARHNRLECQWAGPGGDALNLGHGSIWLTDYHAGTIERLALKDALSHCYGSRQGHPAR